jgi:hypothetical protein
MVLVLVGVVLCRSAYWICSSTNMELLIFGHPLDWWNTQACLSGAQPLDIEITARGHRCGLWRMSKDGTAETGSRVDFDAMSAGQRLMWTFDMNAPCCTGKASWLREYEAQLRGRKRTLAEVMRDKAVSERASTLVRGRSPKQLLRELAVPKSGWQD